MFAKQHAGLSAAAAALVFAVLAGGSVQAQDLSNPSGNWGGSYSNTLPNSKDVYHSHININGSSGDWDGYKIENLAPINRSARDQTVIGWSWEHYRGDLCYVVTMVGRGINQDGTPHVYVGYDVKRGNRDGEVLYSGAGYFDLNGTGDPPGDILGVPMDH